MSFADLKGQDSAINYLKAALRNDRISHAYIFSGPDGVGKMLAALNFAKAINCADVKSGSPCDQCPSCKKIDNSSHPDVFILKAREDGGAIKIEDVRALIKDAYLRPFEAKKKVYIIDSAQEMKHEAANALLKILEEPPADSIIILLTENIKALFQTIVSRSQVVRFFPLKLKEIEAILVKEHSLKAEDARILSHLSGGKLGEALAFKDGDLLTKRAILINKISSRLKADLDFDDIPKEDIRVYLDMMLAWYSDILNLKAGGGDYMLVNIDKKDIISNEAKRLSYEKIEEIIEGLIATIKNIDQNANQKLALSVLGAKIRKAA